VLPQPRPRPPTRLRQLLADRAALDQLVQEGNDRLGLPHTLRVSKHIYGKGGTGEAHELMCVGTKTPTPVVHAPKRRLEFINGQARKTHLRLCRLDQLHLIRRLARQLAPGAEGAGGR